MVGIVAYCLQSTVSTFDVYSVDIGLHLVYHNFRTVASHDERLKSLNIDDVKTASITD